LSRGRRSVPWLTLVSVAACRTSEPPRPARGFGMTPDSAITGSAAVRVPAESGPERDTPAAAIWKALIEEKPGINIPEYRSGILVPSKEVPMPRNTDCYPYQAFCTSAPASPPPPATDSGLGGCYPFTLFIGQVKGAGPVWLVAFDMDTVPSNTNLADLQEKLTLEKRRKDPNTCCYLLAACK